MLIIRKRPLILFFLFLIGMFIADLVEHIHGDTLYPILRDVVLILLLLFKLIYDIVVCNRRIQSNQSY